MIRFLADENIPLNTVLHLRRAGVNLISIGEENPTISDEEVLSQARSTGRVLLTCDRDFGELIFRRGLAPPEGIVYLRVIPRDPQEFADIILEAMETIGGNLLGNFVVVEATHIRLRPLPESEGV